MIGEMKFAIVLLVVIAYFVTVGAIDVLQMYNCSTLGSSTGGTPTGILFPIENGDCIEAAGQGIQYTQTFYRIVEEQNSILRYQANSANTPCAVSQVKKKNAV